MRIGFMGTPEFAATSLEALIAAGLNVVAVVTAPDRPAGRGRKIQEPAVKLCARKYSLPVLQPEKLKDQEFRELLKSYQVDLLVVVAFRMLPGEIWKLPPLGTINLHASLLPDYRGAAPINWAVINGETRTGTTTFFIDQEIDTGNIISQHEVEILPGDNAGTLHDKLMHSGALHLVQTVQEIACKNTHATPQKAYISGQTLHAAPKIFRETCRIIWDQPAVQIHNQIRGLSPYPVAWTTFTNLKESLTLKIYEAYVQSDPHVPVPGTVETDHRNILRIAAQQGWIVVTNLQLEGKKRMEIRDFLRGMHSPEAMSKYRMS